jgi:hypothetical protein
MSAFIRRLKEGEFPPQVRMVSIYSKEDRFSVFPSPLLETEGHPNLSNIEVPGLGHRDFLVKKKVYDLIAEQLRADRADEAERELESEADSEPTVH